MKNLTTTIIFILGFLPFSLVAQDFWEQLPFPDTARIWCFDVNSQNEIFVGTGGDNTHGCIYKSSDNGQSWSVFYDFNGELIARIGITDSGKIFVAKGGIEQLVYSEDNGESWNIIEPPSYAYLGVNEMLCVGNDTVYMGFWEEDGALLVRTVDNGQTYDSLFRTVNHTSEYIGDILVANNSDIYLGLGGYFPDMGGVYKSIDFGQSWEFIGLLNRNISGLSLNSNNDLFVSVRGTADGYPRGIYVLRNDSIEWENLYSSPIANDIIINSSEYLFISSSGPEGVVRSLDNGESFEWINTGFLDGTIGELLLDNDEYIYAKAFSPYRFLYRSINTTVGLDNLAIGNRDIIPPEVFPNPFKNEINIKLENLSNNTNIVTIYRTDGGTVFKQSYFDTFIKIQPRIKGTGIYLLKLETSNSIYSYKLIKY